LISKLEHKIESPVPSLFTFNIKDKRIAGLPGISVPDTEIKIDGTKLNSSGPLLITHWGMSGPAVLKLSAWGARELYNCNYKFDLIINWLPGFNPERLKEKLIWIKNQNLNKNIFSFSPIALPIRLWESLLGHLGLSKEFRWNNLPSTDLNRVSYELTHGKFSVNGKSTFKEEFVTCGGVNTDEINFKTMESKIHKGLYFAGEIIDIDAVTGGFNFQSAWTTAYLAGINSSNSDSS
jgi:predicted Rossmann fold flavoprotein